MYEKSPEKQFDRRREGASPKIDTWMGCCWMAPPVTAPPAGVCGISTMAGLCGNTGAIDAEFWSPFHESVLDKFTDIILKRVEYRF
jgi:hypothetical protein